MSLIKTVAGFAAVAVAAAFAAKAQREPELETDTTVRPVIESCVRMNAAEFRPHVDLVQRDLVDFSILDVQITRPRITALLASTIGENRSYDAYVRFREGGGERCFTLTLEWKADTGAWTADRAGVADRCGPMW
jgi:hypothetical protein